MNENIKKEIEKVLHDEIAYIAFDETSTKEKYALYGFLLKKFSRNVGSDTDLVNELTVQLMSADKAVKEEFVETFFDGAFGGAIDNLRICDTCGDWMIEGYVLGDEYACSRECAIKNYMNTTEVGAVTREEATKTFEHDLELDENNCLGEVYWTDWR